MLLNKFVLGCLLKQRVNHTEVDLNSLQVMLRSTKNGKMRRKVLKDSCSYVFTMQGRITLETQVTEFGKLVNKCYCKNPRKPL